MGRGAKPPTWGGRAELGELHTGCWWSFAHRRCLGSGLLRRQAEDGEPRCRVCMHGPAPEPLRGSACRRPPRSTYSARSPSCRSTPTLPAMVTPSMEHRVQLRIQQPVLIPHLVQNHLRSQLVVATTAVALSSLHRARLRHWSGHLDMHTPPRSTPERARAARITTAYKNGTKDVWLRCQMISPGLVADSDL